MHTKFLYRFTFQKVISSLSTNTSKTSHLISVNYKHTTLRTIQEHHSWTL